MPQLRPSTLVLTVTIASVLGCSGRAFPAGDSGVPGTDAGMVPDGGSPPTDAGVDAGPEPIPPPDALTSCEVDEILGFVNDTNTSATMLEAVGLSSPFASALVAGRSYADALALGRVPGMSASNWLALGNAAIGCCPLPGGEPALQVRFTSPQCAAVAGVPAGVRCEGTSAERDASRSAAGIVDQLVRWIDATRRVKEAHPEREVRIVMAYLVWSDYRVYDALCRATAAGVRLEGFFDAGVTDTQPDDLLADASCNQANIDISFLGGVTEPVEDWRLMHIKMMLFDTGEPTTRLVFGSANLTTTGSTLHFENWVFARFPSDSHFVESHRCARDALVADRYDSTGGYPNVFRSTYDACIAGLSATPDPDYTVYFTPDSSEAALGALVGEIGAATSSVDLAVQHFSNYTLGAAIRDVGRDTSVSARLLLDDDTWYDVGETGGTDRAMYDALLADEPVDIRFLQTNYYFDFGWQFQHNKFVVIDDDAVFCGAGNFTAVAFRDNYENFYFLRSPAVVAQYRAEFDRLYGLGKPSTSLPVDPDF